MRQRDDAKELTVNRDDIIAQIDAIMIEDFEVEPEVLIPEALLGDDLGLDSLDAVDLVVAIERTVGCRIKEAEARQMRTLGDIHDYLEQWTQTAAENT
ncbi:MAG: acyl carrier protein [bacterium]|nr:acyl carrier protein [bacterium]